MERRKFTREFKLEAVRLIKERGVSYTQASQDLGVIILTSACSIIQHFCIEPIAGEISWSAAGPTHLVLKRRSVMPGVKYYLRQAKAFLSHAQSITDLQLKARYSMMAQRYSDMASESAGEPEEVASETDDRQGPPRNLH
jgi:hypothetical protein